MKVLVSPRKHILQLRSLSEILFNSAAMVAAKIGAIPRNAGKSFPIFYAP